MFISIASNLLTRIALFVVYGSERQDQFRDENIINNLRSDDQKAMIANSARERRSKLAVQERAGRAGSVGGIGRPKQNSLSDNATDKLSQPKRDTRAEVARETKVPERKLRAAAEVKKASQPRPPRW